MVDKKFERVMELCWMREQQKDGERSPPLLVECPVCVPKTMLAYKSIWVATCRAGHLFDRCKLTLLPITDPSWRKTCSDCKLDFIDEYKHPGLKVRSTVNQCDFIENDSANSNDVERFYFINHIFREFDRCPYCNGHYTG